MRSNGNRSGYVRRHPEAWHRLRKRLNGQAADKGVQALMVYKAETFLRERFPCVFADYRGQKGTELDRELIANRILHWPGEHPWMADKAKWEPRVGEYICPQCSARWRLVTSSSSRRS
jgi:hypothetical protein